MHEINFGTPAAPQDVVKLCFQAAYGAEHLLTNLEKAQSYFDAEVLAASAEGAQKNSVGRKIRPTEFEIPLFEKITANVCRVNIQPWVALGLPPGWLFSLFVLSAANETAPQQKEQLFFRYIQQANGLAAAGNFPFTLTQWQEYWQQYQAKTGGKPQAVHHSQAYRQQQNPAYRVIAGEYVQVAEAASRLAGLAAGVIAIDGRAAAGKTTLAANLAKITGACIIHMDDFFLPPQLRTPQRLAQPGGNIHHERFAKEVLPHINSGAAFKYNIFDCSIMAINGQRQIPASPWRIVEGVYSQHPIFGDYANVKLFCDIDKTTQMERILKRNGQKMAERFEKEWLPMEEEYFAFNDML
ncbi:MAG: hypothetical protein FWC78_04650 [Defluviitaleaceae bacterium]|nr:hypothetical protein [Defluviitaleaceae bacterium]